jgi:hypothetical protein
MSSNKAINLYDLESARAYFSVTNANGFLFQPYNDGLTFQVTSSINQVVILSINTASYTINHNVNTFVVNSAAGVNIFSATPTVLTTSVNIVPASAGGANLGTSLVPFGYIYGQNVTSTLNPGAHCTVLNTAFSGATSSTQYFNLGTSISTSAATFGMYRIVLTGCYFTSATTSNQLTLNFAASATPLATGYYYQSTINTGGTVTYAEVASNAATTTLPLTNATVPAAQAVSGVVNGIIDVMYNLGPNTVISTITVNSTMFYENATPAPVVYTMVGGTFNATTATIGNLNGFIINAVGSGGTPGIAGTVTVISLGA